MSSNFWYRSFVAVFENLGVKLPVIDDVMSSHEKENCPFTSLNENCIEFDSQTDRNYYVDLRQTHWAVKLKRVKGCGYETYNSREVKKEH